MLIPLKSSCQYGYGNNWIIGYNSSETSGTILDFNTRPVSVLPVAIDMFLEGSITMMSDSSGHLLFYSNGCLIANNQHELMSNGDSIGLGKLETSFCEMGGNPMTQGIMALPAPNDSRFYYLFYTDIQTPYEFPTGMYFPLAPLNLYYALIDISGNNGMGEVVLKNQVVVSDTFSRGMLQAAKHQNDQDWWILFPKSHSNCYYTIKLTNEGIDTVFLQCTGEVWNDRDATGQAVFSPKRNKYVRVNYFNKLNIYDFDYGTGYLSNPIQIGFDKDTFYYSGAAFSSNSKFLYISTFDKVFQFDIQSPNIETSKFLIAELNTPPNISTDTKFNQALLAPDGRIYIGGTSSFNYLHRINNPNCKGAACNLEQYAIETFSYNIYGMPNMPNYINWNEEDECDTTVNILTYPHNNELKIFPNPFNDFIHIEGNVSFTIQIYNSIGICMVQEGFHNSPVTLALSALSNGLYFYRIVINNQVIQQGRLIKT